MTFKLNSLLKSKALLYSLTLVSLMTVLNSLYLNDLKTVTFFVVVGYLTTFFSKNMIVVLGAAVVATNLLMRRSVFEGMKEGAGHEKEGEEKEAKEEEEKREEKIKEKDTEEAEEAEEAEDKEEFEPYMDRGATMKANLKSLEGLIGGKGINGLTEETKELMKTQETMVKAMEGMGPLVEKMGTMMEGLNGLGGGILGGGKKKTK